MGRNVLLTLHVLDINLTNLIQLVRQVRTVTQKMYVLQVVLFFNFSVISPCYWDEQTLIYNQAIFVQHTCTDEPMVVH